MLWAGLYLGLTLAGVLRLPAPRSVAAVALVLPAAGWPAALDGRPITALPLTAREARFVSGFPGRVGRFTDGRRAGTGRRRWDGAADRGGP